MKIKAETSITHWLLLIAAAASFVMLCSAPPLYAQGGYNQIVSVHSGLCLDVFEWRRESGANIQQHSCHGGENQLFLLEPGRGGNFRVIAAHSRKCLDIAGVRNGANVQQWDCHSGPNQQFRLKSMGDGSFLFLPVHSNKCLDVWNWGTENHANIQQWDCHGGNNQRWWLRPR